MSQKFNLQTIKHLQKKLKEHPIYETITTREELSFFMQRHVYSVWDFMSLVKYLQNTIAPTTFPWVPSKSNDLQHFINAIVTEEESDEDIDSSQESPRYTSHFQLYLRAMREVELSSTSSVESFVECVESNSLKQAFLLHSTPEESLEFMKSTFAAIQTDQAHIVAAVFAFGREHIIPKMFTELLEQMKIRPQEAPVFHYYLNRHITLDGDVHGPMALKMVEELCGDDTKKIQEAQEAAQKAIEARIRFWDSVLEGLRKEKELSA